MKNRVITFLSYVLTALLACVVTTFLLLGNRMEGYNKLQQLEQLIDKEFIGEVDKTTLEDAAASGMISALGDRWSYYIPADQYAQHLEQVKNSYVGIGVTVRQLADGTGLEVLEATEGSPAQVEGIQPGDVIVAVEGEPITKANISDISNRIRGEEGTAVALTIRRGDTEQALSVTRKTFQTPVATATLLSDGAGLITIKNFNERCAEETIAAIESLMGQGATKLIFDVRNNPGGYKTELVKILDYLLPEGVLFRSEYADGTKEEDRSDEKHLDIPMAVLVNGNSYSAAEFFAAALQEYGAATVVGTKTTGKGYFQLVYKLSDGSAVGLSVGKYFTPKGVALEGVGITPDVLSEVDGETFEKIQYGLLEPQDDPQILAAQNALTKE